MEIAVQQCIADLRELWASATPGNIRLRQEKIVERYGQDVYREAKAYLKKNGECSGLWYD